MRYERSSGSLSGADVVMTTSTWNASAGKRMRSARASISCASAEAGTSTAAALNGSATAQASSRVRRTMARRPRSRRRCCSSSMFMRSPGDCRLGGDIGYYRKRHRRLPPAKNRTRMTSVRTRGDPTQYPTLHRSNAKAWCHAAIAAALIFASPPSPAAADASGDAPASIDSLFGDAAAKDVDRDRDVKLNGYVGSEFAYTYASPAHWSRMLFRGQLDATGAFSENVKWKLSGRIDYDAVYNLTDFYPPAVAHNARFNFFARENYIDVNAE